MPHHPLGRERAPRSPVRVDSAAVMPPLLRTRRDASRRARARRQRRRRPRASSELTIRPTKTTAIATREHERPGRLLRHPQHLARARRQLGRARRLVALRRARAAPIGSRRPIPVRIGAPDDRDDREVVGGRRREVAHSSVSRAPRVVARRRAANERPDQVRRRSRGCRPRARTRRSSRAG